MHKILVTILYFQYTLHMFRTALVHLREQLYKLYIAFGICCPCIRGVLEYELG